MNRLIHIVLVITATLLLFGSVTLAQDAAAEAAINKYVSLLRKDLRSDKKQFIALNMNLTEAEATKFWPVYDRYTTEQAAIYDTRIAIIKEYGANYDKLTDATAASLNRRATEVDQSLTTLRMKYIPLVAKVLPGKKSALFFQLDKRIGLLVDLQIASEIPLVTQ